MVFVYSEKCHTIGYRIKIFSANGGMFQNAIYPFSFIFMVSVDE